MQKLLLKTQHRTMLDNGARNAWRAGRDEMAEDFRPVVKLFVPWGSMTWLLTELDPDDPDIAFGLCDLGQGTPELGYVRLSELRSVRGPFGLYIERDIHFHANKTLSAYAAAARVAGRILA